MKLSLISVNILLLLLLIILATVSFYGSFVGTINFFNKDKKTTYHEYNRPAKIGFLIAFVASVIGAIATTVKISEPKDKELKQAAYYNQFQIPAQADNNNAGDTPSGQIKPADTISARPTSSITAVYNKFL